MRALSSSSQPQQGHMTQEEFDAFGYPQIPSHWDEEWIRKQLELEKVDPRVNPNLLLDETQQEFWDNMSRKPYAKAVLRTEQHWNSRRRAWIRQYERVELGNALREELAEELEACPVDLKRLVAPIMKYKITEISLATSLRQAKACHQPLAAVLARAEEQQRLHSLRVRLDEGGESAAEGMLKEFTARAEERMLEAGRLRQEREKAVPIMVDSDTMSKHMNQAQKLRKDGYIEWEKGSYEEAFASWREAEAHLYRKRLFESEAEGNKLIDELHLILLKNVAQAAIKLGQFSDALLAADDALAIDDQDPKAWFRRACALEGLGRYDEQEAALACIEDLAVGRPDRHRLVRDVDTRRRHIAALAAGHAETERRSLQRAVERSVFSSQREPVEDSQDEDEAELKRLEEELLQLETEEATLQSLEAAEGAREPKPSLPFRAGDRVVATRDSADVLSGQCGTVLEVDSDGDIKVLFDGQSEAQLIFSVDFSGLSLDVASSSSSSSTGSKSQAALPPRASMCLTQDGASDLLEALASAYQDSGFQQQVAKLARDVRWNAEAFLSHLPKVALGQQREVLQRWGFEGSLAGAREAEQALRDATAAAASGHQGLALKLQTDQVTRLLYGEMHEVIFRQPHRDDG